MTNEQYKAVILAAYNAVQEAWANCLSRGDRAGCDRTKALADALAEELRRS